ncbi:unannotated protein [freshwater metagenome]|uniref:Unannotated protein n=1 Tax=freshwater metagenome TaxID=449393 RepID=A0A6J6WCM8_9ZZZZ
MINQRGIGEDFTRTYVHNDGNSGVSTSETELLRQSLFGNKLQSRVNREFEAHAGLSLLDDTGRRSRQRQTGLVGQTFGFASLARQERFVLGLKTGRTSS